MTLAALPDAAPKPPAGIRSRRGGTVAQRLRFAAVEELRSKGVPAPEAFWQVFTSDELGTEQWIKRRISADKPSEFRLRSRYTNLRASLSRDLADGAIAEARAMIAVQMSAIIQTLVTNATTIPTRPMLGVDGAPVLIDGKPVDVVDKDAAFARSVQQKAAETLLRAEGLIGQGGGTQVNTQVNVSVEPLREVQARATEILAGRPRRPARIEDDAPPPEASA